MIQGPNTIANIVLSSAELAAKSRTVMTYRHHLSRSYPMKKTAIALLSLLGLAVVVKLVRDQI